MNKWTESLKLTVLLMLALLCVGLRVTAQDVPATLGDAIGSPLTGVFLHHHYVAYESADADLLAQLAGWELSEGFTPEWYTDGAPIAGYPIKRLCLYLAVSTPQRCDIAIDIYASTDDPSIIYPAIWSFERRYGEHVDKDLHNHPDLGWWATDAANLDALIVALTEAE